ncbi:MAG TPA: DNA-protecting protein DprA [Ruminococcus sp.]|nr:DNA-protecting protein DprA [Ruminococcus sp.]
MTSREALFALSLIFKPGEIIVQELLEIYEDPAELYSVLVTGSDSHIPHEMTAKAKAFDLQYASDIYGYCDKNDINIIPRTDEGSPDNFRHIDCPPLAFYCLGSTYVTDNKHALTIVGARNATSYSVKIANAFAADIAGEGHPIISGFARGIDSAAHWGAINAGGKTVAVLGCGIHYDYPRGNGQLKAAIANNGAVISEYPPLESPDRSYFTIRNRMIAGLAKAVLVVQANEQSGSLNTASHALDQGKDIFVIPPCDLFAEEFKGQTSLLRDGASPAYSPEDILTEL